MLATNELFFGNRHSFATTHSGTSGEKSSQYCMFGFSLTRLDDYADFYSVEPAWIEQMKRVEAADKQLKGVSTKSKSNRLLTMVGKAAGQTMHTGGGEPAAETSLPNRRSNSDIAAHGRTYD